MLGVWTISLAEVFIPRSSSRLLLAFWARFRSTDLALDFPTEWLRLVWRLLGWFSVGHVYGLVGGSIYIATFFAIPLRILGTFTFDGHFLPNDAFAFTFALRFLHTFTFGDFVDDP